MSTASELNPAPLLQRLDPLSMPLQGLQVIEASAGTGKTWTVAALYVRLVLGHTEAGLNTERALFPPQILVMTFTDAATELRGRVRERLAQAARCFADSEAGRAEADDFLLSLRDQVPEADWSACAARLDIAAQWMDEAAIFTIHGWSSRMLRQHAFDSASLFEQQRVEDGDALRLAAAQDYWRRWCYPLALEQIGAIAPLGGTPQALLERLQPLWSLAERAPGQAPYAGPEPDALVARWAQWQARREPLEARARAGWTPELVQAVSDAAAAKQLKNYRPDWLAGWLARWRPGCRAKASSWRCWSALRCRVWSSGAGPRPRRMRPWPTSTPCACTCRPSPTSAPTGWPTPRARLAPPTRPPRRSRRSSTSPTCCSACTTRCRPPTAAWPPPSGSSFRWRWWTSSRTPIPGSTARWRASTRGPRPRRWAPAWS